MYSTGQLEMRSKSKHDLELTLNYVLAWCPVSGLTTFDLWAEKEETVLLPMFPNPRVASLVVRDTGLKTCAHTVSCSHSESQVYTCLCVLLNNAKEQNTPKIASPTTMTPCPWIPPPGPALVQNHEVVHLCATRVHWTHQDFSPYWQIKTFPPNA